MSSLQKDATVAVEEDKVEIKFNLVVTAQVHVHCTAHTG